MWSILNNELFFSKHTHIIDIWCIEYYHLSQKFQDALLKLEKYYSRLTQYTLWCYKTRLGLGIKVNFPHLMFHQFVNVRGIIQKMNWFSCLAVQTAFSSLFYFKLIISCAGFFVMKGTQFLSDFQTQEGISGLNNKYSESIRGFKWCQFIWASWAKCILDCINILIKVKKLKCFNFPGPCHRETMM